MGYQGRSPGRRGGVPVAQNHSLSTILKNNRNQVKQDLRKCSILTNVELVHTIKTIGSTKTSVLLLIQDEILSSNTEVFADPIV